MASTGTSLLITNFQVKQKNGSLNWRLCRKLRVPRCLQESKREKSVSVQTFVDASSEAYGAVSYLRSEYAQGCYVVRIIASKTRVCPLTPMSTPRLELMAAVLGLRLTLSILAALDGSIGHARFWSDSMNVLY